MNKRQAQKQITREKIITAAKQIFIEKGIINTATAQIAELAGIAHGTLFLHFPNKDALVIELLDVELIKFSDNIKQLILETSDIDKILDQYLNLIQAEEGFFSSLARELPNYKDELRRKILFRESLMREHFHQVIEKGIEQNIYTQIDIPSALTFLFGTINYYLSLKSSFVHQGSVIEKFHEQIIDIFMKILKK
ncbi:MAG: TetR/AcrR family transcriptional regulator [Candidatus Cloacimonetes bacterium]|jgi:AcrR family transcriptional regulator|nr:TetR/AcrR family transcriptional regulator [Candidatus Cloacimonadota bacterium]